MHLLASVVSLGLLLGTASAGEAQIRQFKNLNYVPGHDVMVHLFEWKWKDIAEECERFLGPKGFGGVQTSPVTENLVIPGRPWWERYQPLSYRWVTRSGNESEFRDMVRRCNKVGVRIYVDLVFNHITADADNAIGTGGSRADPRSRHFPDVPYSADDFHYPCEITNYQNAEEVRYCELSGLHDLDQGKEHVRGRIVKLMNELLAAGVAGFRIDAAKHMSPNDIETIYSRTRSLDVSSNFPNDSPPYIFQEVIDFGFEGISKWEYNKLAAVTEFSFGLEISRALNGHNQLKWLKNFGEEWGLLRSQDAFVFIDNHDTQRHDRAILTYKSSKLYKIAVAFMLAHPYGTPRVMSSFDFAGFDQGPPADAEGNIVSPSMMDDGTCGNGWVCEHRWRQIYNMVAFRNTVAGTTIEDWWDNGNNQIAFSRGDRGFIAINVDNVQLDSKIQTKLPPGNYCDVISGNLIDGRCSGKTVNVDESGKAHVQIFNGDEDGVVAIHRNAKLSN